MKTETIECTKCQGTGKIPLTPELQIVVNLIRRKPSITANQIRDILDPDGLFCPTAFHSRIRLLSKYGLIGRKKVGAEYVYFLT